MVAVTIEDGSLICEVEGAHKFWACRSRLAIPLTHVRGVTIRSEETQRWWHGWKMVGTDLPGVFAAGVFRVADKWVFWDVRHPENAIEIDLVDETFNRLLVEVEDPEATAALIQSAIAG
jgi:hypothetical protein